MQYLLSYTCDMTEYELNKKNILNAKMLMIEHDSGYISPEDERNKQFINEVRNIESGKLTIVEPLVVHVVLQKYGVLNRNGRIYPKEILVRQNEVYQEAIRERRALGECVPAGTEILTTNNGWMKIEDIAVGEEVYTINLNTIPLTRINPVESKLVTTTIKKPYKDDLVHIYSDKIDMNLTKNHKVILWDENDTHYILTAIEVYELIKNNDEKLRKSYVKNITEKIYLTNIEASLEAFDGDVYCVSTPNKNWLMRYNGKSAWTHNCDHPESSVISADRVSHNITKTWWEGNTLMGTMEILMSPGFIKSGIVSTKGDDVANLLRHGIKIGVSSRGIGSLAKDKTGNLVVQEDFELICWDVVTAPSTPGAWITPPSQHSKLSENEIKPTNLLNDNLDKFLID